MFRTTTTAFFRPSIAIGVALAALLVAALSSQTSSPQQGPEGAL